MINDNYEEFVSNELAVYIMDIINNNEELSIDEIVKYLVNNKYVVGALKFDSSKGEYLLDDGFRKILVLAKKKAADSFLSSIEEEKKVLLEWFQNGEITKEDYEEYLEQYSLTIKNLEVFNKVITNFSYKKETPRKTKLRFLSVGTAAGTRTEFEDTFDNVGTDLDILAACLPKLENALMACCDSNGNLTIIKTVQHGNGLHKVDNHYVYKNKKPPIRVLFVAKGNDIFILGAVKTHGNNKKENDEKAFYETMENRLNHYLKSYGTMTEETRKILESLYLRDKEKLYLAATRSDREKLIEKFVQKNIRKIKAVAKHE